MRNYRHIRNARRRTRDRLFPPPCTRPEKHARLRELPGGRYLRKQNQEWSERSLSLCPRRKMEMVKVNMRVESIEGFSGHSDRNQLLGFIKRMTPKPTKIIVNHGERRKSDLFAQNVNRIFGIKTVVPDVLESIRLR